MTPEQIRRECEDLEARKAALERELDAADARLYHLRHIVCAHPERVSQLSADPARAAYLCADCGKQFWPNLPEAVP